MEIMDIKTICDMYETTRLGAALGITNYSTYGSVMDPSAAVENLMMVQDAINVLERDDEKKSALNLFRDNAMKNHSLASCLKAFLESQKTSGLGWLKNGMVTYPFGRCLDLLDGSGRTCTAELMESYLDACEFLSDTREFRSNCLWQLDTNAITKVADTLVRLRADKGWDLYCTAMELIGWIPVKEIYGEGGYAGLYDDLAAVRQLGQDGITFPCGTWEAEGGHQLVKRLADPEFSSFLKRLGKYGEYATVNLLTLDEESVKAAHRVYSDTAAFMTALANGNPEDDLDYILRQYVKMMDRYQWDEDVMVQFLTRAKKVPWDAVSGAFANNASFADFCSGGKWRGLIQATVDGNAALDDLISYAVVTKKTGFLKMAEKDPSVLLGLNPFHIFLDPDFWAVCNINTLSRKDLECLLKKGKDGFHGWTYGSSDANRRILSEAKKRIGDRKFTFNEVKLLLNHQVKNLYLYLNIDTGSVDQNLLRMRQLMKPHVQGIIFSLGENGLKELGDSISKQSLASQMEAYSYIKGLTPENLLRKYCYSKDFWDPIEEGFRNAKENRDIDIVFSNLDNPHLKEYGIQGFKEHFLEFDEDSMWLLEQLDIPKAEMERGKGSIMEFCLSGCATITRKYYNGSYETQQKNVLLIAMAEMLGRMDDLKYTDLRKELGVRISDAQFGLWQQDGMVTDGKFAVTEYVDFFHVMQIGHGLVGDTCMSYADGCYRECLLSNFDGNKKILYATHGYDYCGRAILRLTRYSETKADNQLHFKNVLEDAPAEGEDNLVLFLERPYQKGVTEDGAVPRALVKAAAEKAKVMGIPLVLAADYNRKDICRCYPKRGYLYVSKSKNGQQYLDSLGGNCENGGYYKNGIFYFYDDSEI